MPTTITQVRRSDFIKVLEREAESLRQYAALFPNRNTRSNDMLTARAQKLAARLRDGKQPTKREMSRHFGPDCVLIDE